MLTAPTFAAALVSGLRTHGERRSGPDGRRWSAVADEARRLALGLAEVGVEPGATIRVRLGHGGGEDVPGGDRAPGGAGGASPAQLLVAEVAVVAAGAALAVDDSAPADLVLDADVLRGSGLDRDLAAVRAAGDERDRRHAAAHEDRLAAIDPDTVALRAGAGAGARTGAQGGSVAVTHAQALWALRSVAAWIGPAAPDGPRAVVARRDGTIAAALVGRWWPATAGAQVGWLDPADPVAAVRALAPDVVVGAGTDWDALADALRAEAGRTRSGTALLRRGRVLAAGEATGWAERAGRGLAERRAGDRIRAAAGLDALALGVALGPLAVATGRDLMASGLPVVATWIEPTVPAPVASGPRARPTPAAPWGRPLPGRTVDVGPPVVVHGGDVGPEGVASPAATEVDGRGRLRLPASGPSPARRGDGSARHEQAAP